LTRTTVTGISEFEKAEVLEREPALDGLRGVAILAVLAHNFDLITQPKSTLVAAGDQILDHGWIGVQLFFVLSGYLITSILLATREAENYFAAFFARRALRIFPLYYSALVVAFFVVPGIRSALGDAGPPIAADGWLWVFLSNWSGAFGHDQGAFPHFWSLAVEEQFYLVWPFVVYALRARGTLVVSAALIAVAVATRCAVRLSGGSPEIAYLTTVCRMDALAVGAVVATLRAGAGRWRLPTVTPRRLAAVIAIVAAGGLGSSLYARTSLGSQTIGYTLLAIGCGAWLAAGTQRSEAGRWYIAPLRASWLRTVGRYSFAMYVVHLPLHVYVGLPLIARLGLRPESDLLLSLGYTAVATLATFALALASYYAIERPFLRLKRLFTPRVGALRRR
jgi:peptidoglycan/LPS O-acetylase OafA/YrhL